MVDNFLNMAQAARLCPGQPHPSAVWRWARRGIKSRAGGRVYLDHVRVGGEIFVTQDALDKFFVELAVSDRPHFAPLSDLLDAEVERPKPQCRQRSIAQAEDQLRTAGILR